MRKSTVFWRKPVYDAEKYAVSVAVTFGYRAKEIRPKSRKPLNEIVHWIE